MENKNIPWNLMLNYVVNVKKMPLKEYWGMTMKEFLEISAEHNKSTNFISKEDLQSLIAIHSEKRSS